MHAEEILMKLNMYLFDKKWQIVRKIQKNLG